ncbi:ran GTPase-activating protein 1 isoform X1 [Neodiprion virginianus]|uniref:ran GTPase-activating protein 1 isoform X1 n=1 Tax=Neodiprion virginianus TaxID=2961670 RepID=UPI001EE6FA3F|nr:ran GTPase-activating protein 1 isoform X1 [Neodiprion virginianus]
MTTFNLTEIQEQLNKASEKTPESGVSFNGKSLKLNSEADAEEVVKAIEQCQKLDYLDLEGNTLGPDAAKAVAKALEAKGSSLKRALWKDMFTGRMKTEIPLALEYLGTGLCAAQTRLVELDLSDNAFGPVGVKGLATLLSSSACFTLRELKLNNNGLGITGGKMLAKALLDCHENSSKENVGTAPLALRVFIAGRNRLENDGAAALAEVFTKLTTLEEISMPQNGIYHKGIAALAQALSVNPRLKILNLNDNTVGPEGARALAKSLPSLPDLEKLNLGDCLLKTRGASVLAEALANEGAHRNLMELNLSFNEIGAASIDAIVAAVADKQELTSLVLDGNVFGSKGRENLEGALIASQKLSVLGSLEENESESEGDSESGEETESEDSDDENKTSEVEKEDDQEISKIEKDKQNVTVQDFLKNPTAENLLRLQGDKIQLFLEHAKSQSVNGHESQKETYAEVLIRSIMKVSSLCASGYMDARIEAERVTDGLYMELFAYATKTDQVSQLNNVFLINLGLIKSEDKTAGRIDWNLEGCFKALEKISTKDYFLTETRNALKVFIELPIKTGKVRVDPFQNVKASLKKVLDQI